MGCRDIEVGTYACSQSIMPPFKTGFPDKKYRHVSIDRCLINEVTHLWELGVKTTGCCCGHGKHSPFIGVEFACIDKMKKLGYKVQPNPWRPGDEDSFYPKTKMLYEIEFEIEINRG